MNLMTCAAVRRRLQDFHDEELPVHETIAIEGHISTCPPCARDLRGLQTLAETLRLAVPPGPADDWAGVQSSVISRMRAEEHESLAAKARRFVDDLHLVWIGLASAAATVVCAGTVLSMLHFASPERNDSLAAVLAVLGAPGGSDLNPAVLDGRNMNGGPLRPQAPTVPQDGVVYLSLQNSMMTDDLQLLLSANVSREGHLSDLKMLSNDVDGRGVQDLMHAISRGRLEPAQYEGAPVAANVVWLVAHTTVKPKT
jgi:hypothetical protein